MADLLVSFAYLNEEKRKLKSLLSKIGNYLALQQDYLSHSEEFTWTFSFVGPSSRLRFTEMLRILLCFYLGVIAQSFKLYLHSKNNSLKEEDLIIHYMLFMYPLRESQNSLLIVRIALSLTCHCKYRNKH